MSTKATRVKCNFDADTSVTLVFSPLAIEDLTDTPCYSFTPAGRAEVVSMDAVPLTGLVKQRLEEFRAAKQAREQAGRGEIAEALRLEEQAALLLAWALDQDAR